MIVKNIHRDKIYIDGKSIEPGKELEVNVSDGLKQAMKKGYITLKDRVESGTIKMEE